MTLGRQGSVSILNRICAMMDEKGIEYITILLSEIYGEKLSEVQCFVQIDCLRLSIDWRLIWSGDEYMCAL